MKIGVSKGRLQDQEVLAASPLASTHWPDRIPFRVSSTSTVTIAAGIS